MQATLEGNSDNTSDGMWSQPKPMLIGCFIVKSFQCVWTCVARSRALSSQLAVRYVYGLGAKSSGQQSRQPGLWITRILRSRQGKNRRREQPSSNLPFYTLRVFIPFVWQRTKLIILNTCHRNGFVGVVALLSSPSPSSWSWSWSSSWSSVFGVTITTRIITHISMPITIIFIIVIII